MTSEPKEQINVFLADVMKRNLEIMGRERWYHRLQYWSNPAIYSQEDKKTIPYHQDVKNEVKDFKNLRDINYK